MMKIISGTLFVVVLLVAFCLGRIVALERAVGVLVSERTELHKKLSDPLIHRIWCAK